MEQDKLEQEWMGKFDVLTGKLRENLSNECYEWAFKNPLRVEELETCLAKKMLRECYEKIVYIHHHYLDWEPEEIKLQALWDIATYFFKGFPTFPYRFITAMKGSAKTRLLKITEALAWRAKLTSGMSESALFRNASTSTLLFDEAESIGRKEKQALREIANSGYKSGSVIIRVKEVKVEGQKTFVNEEFPIYSPKMFANIWGMEEVLGDRCISSVIEKSGNPAKTKLIEDFGTNSMFLEIKRTLEALSVVLCSVVMDFWSIEKWNSYIFNRYTTTYTTYTTTNYTILHTSQITPLEREFFEKIDNTNLQGRDLELYFPLFIVGKLIDDDLLEHILVIAKEKSQEKKTSDFLESKDIALIDFISKMEPNLQFRSIKELTHDFKMFYEDDDEGLTWLNPKWFGRAMKRLKLVLTHRRLGRGIDIIPDVIKARERIKIFKSEGEK